MEKILTASLLILLFVVFSTAQNKSIYTSTDTKNCKTIEQSDKEAGWYRGHCPGVSGYKLELTEGDLRQSISVIAPNKKKYELNFGSVSGGFSSVGAKAEWRVKGTTPAALIIRFNVSENPEDSSKITSYLIVSKVTKTSACITDVIKPMPNQNAEAQNWRMRRQVNLVKYLNNLLVKSSIKKASVIEFHASLFLFLEKVK